MKKVFALIFAAVTLAAFIGAVVGEIVVISVSQLTEVAYLWYNVIGCAVVVIVALAVNGMKTEELRIEN